MSLSIPGLDSTRLRNIISSFPSKRILVIGDLVADEYILCESEHIAREAPIPVLNSRKEWVIPGGAANVAVNTHTLGSMTSLVGVVGQDIAAERLRVAVTAMGISDDGFIRDASRATLSKTRILAGNPQQHVARIDRCDRSDMSTSMKQALMKHIEQELPGADALIFSDYEYGLLSTDVINFCIQQGRQSKKIITADSHGSLFRFQGVTALTPSQPEAEMTLGRQAHTQIELEDIGNRLIVGSNANAVLITRGSQGMSLFQRDDEVIHVPVFMYTGASDIVDTTGAGDTVTATFTLALASGATMTEAAWLANVAAARVVRKMGCASNTPGDLLEMIGQADI
jgi:rfaE bifunctional protein kinase chain/domain